MNNDISKTEQMFNDIRIEIAKETKGMTPEQESEYYGKGVEKFLERSGLKKVPNGRGYILVRE